VPLIRPIAVIIIVVVPSKASSWKGLLPLTPSLCQTSPIYEPPEVRKT
jgi:hypothetical protein